MLLWTEITGPVTMFEIEATTSRSCESALTLQIECERDSAISEIGGFFKVQNVLNISCVCPTCHVWPGLKWRKIRLHLFIRLRQRPDVSLRNENPHTANSEIEK